MAGLMKRLFRGTESAAEEKAEARAVRSGKITPKQYVAGEKSEGETEPGMMARAKALKSGKMSPAAYAAHEKAEKKPAAKKMAAGGMTAGKAAHAVKEGKRVAKEMEYDYKAGKKSFAGTTAQKDAHAEKEGRKVAKAMEYDYSKGRKMATGGCTAKPKKMASGGSARGCGIAVKGKTKGRMV